MHKNILRYVILLLTFGLAIFFTLEIGAHLYSNQAHGAKSPTQVSESGSVAQPNSAAPASNDLGSILQQNLRLPLSVLLLQIIVILFVAKMTGRLFRKLGQPLVTGEIIAGVLLGPSLLGALSPETMAFLFPPQSMDSLKMLSQIGIIIFMFTVGTELNLKGLRQNAHTAVMVSHASIVIPFFFGAAFSLLTYPSFAPANITFHAYALFMSVAMSITAFPVLARIIEERGMSKSYIGSTAIACAAVDDATAWCLLAVVIAIVKTNGLAAAALTIILTLFFIALMLYLLKPRVEHIISREIERNAPDAGLMVGVLAFAFASALFTEIIGIHALFGAFLAGIAMPSHSHLRSRVTERLEVFTTSFLLPLYFVFTGLRTQIGLLNDWASWLMCAGVIVIAIAGKLGGGTLAARWAGMSWRDSLNLGVLMNTRGLIELIVLNIGYDLGILSPQVYSMMVLMALVTTFMTGPLLSLIETLKQERGVLASKAGVAPDVRVEAVNTLSPDTLSG
jgi:Kef-type K+ transport system membrane component KefB